MEPAMPVTETKQYQPFHTIALTLYGPNSFFRRFSGHNPR